MRRLSIIDLVTGHQPISNEDDTVWIVFNGEIYNYPELRRDLANRGHCFRTNSDTETIVHLYEDLGVECFDRLRGMFACAIWDSRSRSLVLSRDRFGKKPLYYSALPRGVWFGSEISCLRAAGVPLELDKQALRFYFPFSYIPDPLSAFRAVRKLMPGHWMRIDGAGRLSEAAYWTLPVPAERAPAGLTEQEACNRIRELFDESVRIRMLADVPLGAFLSGGLDSSSVVASMALQSSAPVRTFSIGFEEAEFSELPAAGLLAARYKTEHHQILLRPDSVDLIERLVRHFDEPLADSSAIPTFLVSQFAARHVKVVLTGDGGDEVFAGYPSFWIVDGLRKFDALPQAFRRLISWCAEQLPYRAYGKNYLRMISRATPLERYFELCTMPFFLRQRLLDPSLMLPGGEAFIRSEYGRFLPPARTDILSEVLYFESTAKLAGQMLVKVDRMSMANSIEVRCPLLDHRLAEYAATLPSSWKVARGRGKRILVKALGDRLPPELLSLPKRGFDIPLAAWFRGPLRSFIWDHLTSSAFTQRGMVSGKAIRYLLDEHDRGRRDNYDWLWRLLVLELWLRNMSSAAQN
jgi:asparagine synthase (glutamine-hydrolysing)